jgi:hypothetical protein
MNGPRYGTTETIVVDSGPILERIIKGVRQARIAGWDPGAIEVGDYEWGELAAIVAELNVERMALPPQERPAEYRLDRIYGVDIRRVESATYLGIVGQPPQVVGRRGGIEAIR